MNEAWYIFGPKNAGGRSPQLQPAQVPGQVQAAPVVNNITYNTAPAADGGGVTDAAGGMGSGSGFHAPMNDPSYGMPRPANTADWWRGLSSSPYMAGH